MKTPLFRRPFRYINLHSCIFIILINVIAYLTLDNYSIIMEVEGTPIQASLAFLMSLNKNLCFGLNMFWQPVSYMFIHGDFNHLFSNMFGLLIFGTVVEKAIGTKEFLLLYFVTGILSGLFSVLVYELTGDNSTLLGASGALFGIMLAFSVIYPKAVLFILGIIPIPAPLLIIGYAVYEMFSQFTGFSSGVAHLTHLFGFAAAWLYMFLRMGINPLKVWKNTYRRS